MIQRPIWQRQTASRALALCGWLIAAGCQQAAEPPPAATDAAPDSAAVAPPPAAPVSVARERVTGVVTLDGHPLIGANVLFSPLETGSAAIGTTDQQGRYELKFSEREPGIAPGHYRVRITAASFLKDAGLFGREYIPQAYNVQSQLLREITAGQGPIDFVLRSDADLPPQTSDRRRGAYPPLHHVVLIVASGLGTDWLGCYGSPAGVTPNLDRLAAEGLRFTNAYSMPHSTAARVTLLTGQYPSRHGWLGDWDVAQSKSAWFDWQRHRSLVRRLHEAEFITCVAGQWQLNNFDVQPDALLQHGFDIWCVWTGAQQNNPATHERYWNPYVYLNRRLPPEAGSWPTRHVRELDWGMAGTIVDQFGPDIAESFALQNLMWINSRRPPPRFFLYYPMTLPAAPLTTTPDAPDATGDAERRLAMVQYVDKLVGQLVDELVRSRHRTLLIFTSDGGADPAFDTAGDAATALGELGILSERRIHVPLIVSQLRSVPEGAVSDALVDFTDLAPTLCELAGSRVQSADEFDGHSLAAVLYGGARTTSREWIMSIAGQLQVDGARVRPVVPFAERVLRDQRYKVHVTQQRSIDALYDLQSDALEAHNLLESELPEHRQAIQKFQRIVDSLPQQDAELKCAPFADEVRANAVAAPEGSPRRISGG